MYCRNPAVVTATRYHPTIHQQYTIPPHFQLTIRFMRAENRL